MDPIGLDSRAADWIKHWNAPIDSSQGARNEHALDVYDLLYEDPETLWLLILEIHHQDQSPRTQQVLSAGPLEDLLAMHGENFIDRCETEARRVSSICQTPRWRLAEFNE